MKINYPAVIVAAIVHFMIGGIWYGLIFGNKFIQLIGWSPEKLAQVGNQNHTKEYVFAFLSSLILVYVLAHFVQYTKAKGATDGMQTGFWLWLGFIATTQLSTVVFEERNFGLYLLNIGYQFVACLLTGALLAVWKPRETANTAVQPA
jgi:Protein of unknown function (DUF1761)